MEDVFEKYKTQIKVIEEGSRRSLMMRENGDLEEPPWLDYEKLKRGQEMAISYYLPICYSNLISLYLIFSHEPSLRQLIFTRKSDTVETAFARYMSTIHRVKSWYDGDLSDPSSEARKHIRTVNMFHKSLASKLKPMNESTLKEASELDESRLERDSDAGERVRKLAEVNNIKIDESTMKMMDEGLTFSQTHMRMTQFGFLGLIVLYPAKFGVAEEDLDSFIHMWRYIGYLLGIEDEHNLCNGTIDEVRIGCRVFLECIFKPCLLEVKPSWEHMSLCVFKGLNKVVSVLIFETTLAFLFNCIELNVDYFYKTMSFKSKLVYFLQGIIFDYMIPIKFIRSYTNSILIMALDKEKYFSPK